MASGGKAGRREGESHQRAEGRDLAEPKEALARSSPTGPLLWQRAMQTWASQCTEALPTTVRSSVPPALAGDLLSTYFAMWLLQDNSFKVINSTSLRHSLQAPLLPVKRQTILAYSNFHLIASPGPSHHLELLLTRVLGGGTLHRCSLPPQQGSCAACPAFPLLFSFLFLPLLHPSSLL